MNTAVLSDGISYYIPSADLTFFKELAARMKWEVVSKMKKSQQVSTTSSWVDNLIHMSAISQSLSGRVIRRALLYAI